MKTVKAIITICIVLVIFSCDNTESTPIDTNAQENDLVGTWSLTEIKQDGTVTTNVQGVPVNANYTSFGKNIDAQVTFSQNPNNFSSSGTFTSVITITLVGQATTREVPIVIDDVLSQGTWQVDQGVITLSQNNETQTVNITELTDTSLKFELELQQDVVIQGVNSTVQTLAKLSFLKQ